MAIIQALSLAELGREHEARNVFELLDEKEMARAQWQEIHMALVDTMVRLEDDRLAEQTYACLARLAEGFLVGGLAGVFLGSAARPLGQLATLMGRFDQAEEHFELAIEMEQKIGARPWLARTQLAYGSLLVKRNRATDAARARELLESGLSNASELGMRGVEAQLRDRLEALRDC